MNEKQPQAAVADTTAVGSIISGLGGAEAMRQNFQEYEEVRAVIHDFIERNFVAGIDYGPSDNRNPKHVLLLPGAEKACKMFDTHATFSRDEDTWEMLGRPPGIVCYICRIVDNKTGVVIGEGRGAEKVGNKSRDANKSIKIAEKCALVDAAKLTFMLSDRFTQDDGGRGRPVLFQLKEQLMADVGEIRHGLQSEMSDLSWLTRVLDNFLHKKRIDTIGEHQAVRKAVFEENLYDLSTGNRK